MFYVLFGLLVVVLAAGLLVSLGKLNVPPGKEGAFIGFLGLCVSALLGLLVFVFPRKKDK